ncbi:PD-(D/E)XK motif protein [Pantoea stewartii]|uniref:PD-(D/E)XK motif protein n=1 Tax=Pantoea stewartii TaxID=66269 RepID=UPI0025A0129C|nr:PD-(D/E)XK motif protein [Pantoea stewartii]MEB6535393.1 PD-(D/E)XK motif protein [Pantoea stewartii]
MKSLMDEFENIGFFSSKKEGFFNAVKISENSNHYLSKGCNGEPLFMVKQLDKSLYHPDITSRYLDVSYNLDCKISTNNGAEVSATFCLIKFDEQSTELYHVFIKCLSSFFIYAPDKMQVSKINCYLQDVIESFREIDSAPKKEITGIWAELFLIKRSRNIDKALSSWRISRDSRFDFDLEDRHYEVKSTTQVMRVHNFSIEQLNDFSGDIYIVSLLLQSGNKGLTVFDLAEIISEKVTDNNLRKKLWNNILVTIGKDAIKMDDLRFEERFANKNCLFFKSKDIPKPKVDDLRVSSVRFRADLTDVTPTIMDISKLFI